MHLKMVNSTIDFSLRKTVTEANSGDSPIRGYVKHK